MKPLSTCSRNRIVRFGVRTWNRIWFARRRAALAREASFILGESITAHHLTNHTTFRRSDRTGGSLAVHYWKRPSPASIAQFLRTNAGNLS